MSLAQTATPRPATQAELQAWSLFKSNFAKTTNAVDAMLTTAVVAANISIQAHEEGLPINYWTNIEEEDLQSFLRTYNTMGRLINGAENEKYFITLEQGDLTIWAPNAMSADQYGADIYPGLGLAWIPIVIGIALITAAITADSALEYAAKSKDLDYKNRLLEADQRMSKAPKIQRDMWIKIKKENTKSAKAAQKKHKPGWFGNMFQGLGEGLGEGVGMLAVGGLALLALIQWNKRRSTQ